jgi:hypothetical protein
VLGIGIENQLQPKTASKPFPLTSEYIADLSWTKLQDRLLMTLLDFLSMGFTFNATDSLLVGYIEIYADLSFS